MKDLAKSLGMIAAVVVGVLALFVGAILGLTKFAQARQIQLQQVGPYLIYFPKNEPPDYLSVNQDPKQILNDNPSIKVVAWASRNDDGSYRCRIQHRDQELKDRNVSTLRKCIAHSRYNIDNTGITPIYSNKED